MTYRMKGDEPLPPRKPGGVWTAVMIDTDGDRWPTGSFWPTREEALRDGERTAKKWNAPARLWWKLWK